VFVTKHVVNVSNGKYTFVRSLGSLRIDRGSVPWVDQVNAPNAVLSMMCELDAARVVVTAARRLVKEATMCGDPVPGALQRALERHASLVDDRELPSDWCGGTEPF
jgi:hypothetical protein